MTAPVVTLLAGGVGGAKVAEGLQASRYADHAAVIGNIGDDDVFHGLTVCPDIDTLIYSLSGQIDREKGWGLRDESYQTLEGLKAFGHETWMTLGDKDFATHSYRTCALNSGATLTEVTQGIAQRFGLKLPIMPPSNDRVPTQIHFDGQWHSFQRYFVQHQCQPEIDGIRYQGAEQATATPEVLKQLRGSDIILLAPSNPLVSIGAILAIPQIRQAIQNSNAFVLAISPFIGGQTVKGPADRMMRALGKAANNIALAEHYSGLIQGLVIDHQDKEDQAAIEALGIKTYCLPTLMQSLEDKAQVVSASLEWAIKQSTTSSVMEEALL